MTESLLLLLALAAIGAAAWFAYRSAGVEPIRAERDRAVAELATLRQDGAKLAAELAAERATGAARAEEGERREQALLALRAEMEKTFQAVAAQALDASSVTSLRPTRCLRNTRLQRRAA